jgi:nucleotide-binding universal stress UspA family protein
MLLKDIEAPPTFAELSPQRRATFGVGGKDPLRIGRILLPVDFTERSIGMTRYAVDLVKRFDAKVTLLHVGETHRSSSDHLASQDGPLTLGQSRVQYTMAELLRSVPFRHVSVHGDPARRIVEHARSESADLILMPTRGRRRWGGLLTNSVTDRVMRHAHCPVWTSVVNAPERVDIKNALCALALAPRNGKVLQWASQLADRFGARLSIVHSSADFAEVPAAGYFYDLHAARRTWARQDICALQQAAGSHAAIWLEPGPPHQAIAAVARRIGADLVVIGRSPRFWPLRKLWTTGYDCIAPDRLDSTVGISGIH